MRCERIDFVSGSGNALCATPSKRVKSSDSGPWHATRHTEAPSAVGMSHSVRRQGVQEVINN